MKILFVSLNYTPEPTGIGKFQGEMAAWFAARGHQVRAITAPPYYPAWKIDEAYMGWHYRHETIDGVEVTRCPLYVPRQPNGVRRLIHLFSFALTSFPVILRQALRERPDAILITAPPIIVAPSVLLAAALSGARPYLHVHDFELDAAFGLGLLKEGLSARVAYFIERWLLRGFPAVSTISRRMRDRLTEKGVPRTHSFLIPNWAGVDDFDPPPSPGNWRAQLCLSDKDCLALYSGNLGRKQGVETIIEAARLIHDRNDIRFVICGDGAARRDMEQDAQGLSNVTFLPLQDHQGFVSLMTAADIHLLPQRAEAADLVMPSKLGNILASGRPVVASANAGTQVYDAVEGCGLAVPPDDAAAFAEAVVRLADHPDQRAAMGVQGRERARQEWRKQSILARMEKLLEMTTLRG